MNVFVYPELSSKYRTHMSEIETQYALTVSTLKETKERVDKLVAENAKLGDALLSVQTQLR